jgi:hypothetical protein
MVTEIVIITFSSIAIVVAIPVVVTGIGIVIRSFSND